MGVYTRNDGNWFSRRGAFLALLVAFHVVFFLALQSGFAVRLIQQVTQPIRAEIINQTQEEEPPPPPLELELDAPAIELPPVLVDIQLPRLPTTLQSGTGTGNVTRAVVRTRGGVAFMPSASDYYPAASRQAGERGTTRVRICYGIDGKVTAAAVAESSGFPRLDEAAVKMAQAARLRPATIDGKAQADCVVLPLAFPPRNGQK